jgi:hypothetical protein
MFLGIDQFGGMYNKRYGYHVDNDCSFAGIYNWHAKLPFKITDSDLIPEEYSMGSAPHPWERSP